MPIIGTPILAMNDSSANQFMKSRQDERFYCSRQFKPASYKSSRLTRTAEIYAPDRFSFMDDRDIHDDQKNIQVLIKDEYLVSNIGLPSHIQMQLSNERDGLRDLTLSDFVKENCEITKSNILRFRVPYDFQAHALSKITRINFGMSYSTRLRTPTRSLDFEEFSAELTSQQASLALNGYMPFTKIPAKHEAYLKFLTYCSKGLDLASVGIDDEWIREFVQSAKIFRPLDKNMQARFTSSVGRSLLETDTENEADTPPSTALRETVLWKPASALCSHFNICLPIISISLESDDLQKSHPLNKNIFIRPARAILREIFGGLN